jgi:hypothetical protein
MIVGFDDDQAGEATRVANRLHGLLTQIHPSLERVLGPRLQHPAVLSLLERFGSPAQIRKAGRRRLVTLLRPKAPRMAERLVEDIFAALDEQTVSVPGTEAGALIVPSLAGSLAAVLDQRKLLAGRIEELLEAHPLSKVLRSMPGIGVRTGARTLIEVGDGSTFPTAGHLAAYAGLAPATRSSGSSIRGEQPSRRGNKQLKGLIPLRVRRPGRPGIADLLRQEDRPGQAPHPGPALPRPVPGRRPVRHAQRWHLLRTPNNRNEVRATSLPANRDRAGHDGSPTCREPPRRSPPQGRSSGAPHAHPAIGARQRTSPSVRRARNPRRHQSIHHRHSNGGGDSPHPSTPVRSRPLPPSHHQHARGHRSRRPSTAPSTLTKEIGAPSTPSARCIPRPWNRHKPTSPPSRSVNFPRSFGRTGP